MGKIALPLTIAIAAASCLLAFTQFQSASGLKSELARISGELGAQQDALAKLQAEKKAAEDSLALLKEDNERLKKERDEAKDKNRQLLADAGTVAAKPPGEAAGGAQKPIDVRGIFQGFAKQMDDPAVRKMMKQGQERIVASAYDALFKKLNLSEQDSKLLADLIAERNVTAMDKGRKILNGATADDATAATIRKDIEATKADYDAKVKSVLGEQKFAEFSSYEKTVGDRRALETFDRNFQGKGQPLAPEQKTALADIMAQERLKSPGNEIPDLGGGPSMGILMSESDLKAREQRDEAFNQRVLSRAAEAGLNPDQVTTLQDSFKQRSEWRSFGARMGRAFIRPQQ